MKVLVHGAGVIGCCLTHVLCRADNDVTLLARGVWKEALERDGLVIRQGMDAVREGYGLLSALNYPILPEGTIEKLTGAKGALSYAVMWVMAKTALGRLAATDHCRHAVSEMEALDGAWAELQAKRPDLPMPNWDALRGAMPDWKVALLHRPRSTDSIYPTFPSRYSSMTLIFSSILIRPLFDIQMLPL